MSLASYSIKRPITILMIFVSLVVVGLISSRQVPLEYFPDITFPGLLVEVPYRGSTPGEVERLITRPIEEVLATVSGIENLNSSSSENSAFFFLQMKMGTDVRVKSIEVREKIDGIRHLLPDDVERILVRSFSANDEPVLNLRISSDQDLSDAYEKLNRQLKSRLERIEGVSKVDLYGVDKKQIQIDLISSRLVTHQVNLAELMGKLQAANFSVTAGTITDNGSRFVVRPVGELRTLDDFADLVIQSNGLRLRDVADVRFAPPEVEFMRLLDQKPAIGVDIFKESGGNTVATVDAVVRELAEIRKHPEMRGIQIFELNNQADGIKSSLRELLNAGFVGALLSTVVLFVFLRSVSATLIVSIAVPLSLIITIGGLYFLGMTLNILSMMGLMLAVGMLVDNAVVVTENIHRHQLMGGDPVEVTIRAVKEVSMAVTAGTLTTIIVFLPNIVSQTDMTAIFLKHVAVTIVLALVSSLVISLTLIPLLTSRFQPKQATEEQGWVRRLQDRYGRMLGWLIARPWWSTGIVVLITASVAIPSQFVKVDMFPEGGGTELRLIYNINGTYTLDKVKAAVDTVETYLYANKDELHIDKVYTYLTTNYAMSTILLIDEDQRTLSMDEIKSRIRENVPKMSIARPAFEFISQSGAESMRVNLIGDSSEELMVLAEEVIRRVRAIDGLTDVQTSAEAGTEEVRLLVDRDRARALGLSSSDVARLVANGMRGQNLRRVRSTQGEVDVLVGFQEGDRETVEQLMQLPISRRGDETITLSAIASFEMRKGPVQIEREDRQTSIAISASLDGITMDEARKRLSPVMEQISYPPGYGWSYGRSFRESESAMNQMVINILLALALIYLVMASLFESTLYPASIITSIGFAVIGVFWFFMLTGTTFDLMAMIGILILMGVVVNNGIVLIDHINQLRSEGMSRTDAIIHGGMNRMRPILMTAGTTILGLLPLCIGTTQIGGDGPPYFPMARAIVGGLAFSTIVSMIVLPTFYIWLDDLRNWSSRIFGDVKVVSDL